MKKYIVLFLFTVLTFAAAHTAKSQSKFDNWPELKTFHKVMSGTFHPMEEGNLAPIRERSGEMVEKATALAASKIPAEYNNKEVQQAVKDLESGSKKLDGMIKDKAGDDDIKKSLTALHDTFHVIVEKCVKGDEHHHEHEHGKE